MSKPYLQGLSRLGQWTHTNFFSFLFLIKKKGACALVGNSKLKTHIHFGWLHLKKNI